MAGSYTLYQNGAKVGTSQAPGYASFRCPRRTRRTGWTQASPTRRQGWSISTRIDTSWTFRSAHVPGDAHAPLPVSAVRFHPRVDARNHLLPGSSAMHVTVERQPGAGHPGNQKLSVSASFDDGHTWQRVAVALTTHQGDWIATVPMPPKPGYVSLRAVASDGHGNSVRQTIIRAYAG